MLLFEFDGALFQFDAREPEFSPLFQLAPNSAAFSPGLPLSLDPGVDHAARFRHQGLGMALLLAGQTVDRIEKP